MRKDILRIDASGEGINFDENFLFVKEIVIIFIR